MTSRNKITSNVKMHLLGPLRSQALLFTVPDDRPKAAASLESDNCSVFKDVR